MTKKRQEKTSIGSNVCVGCIAYERASRFLLYLLWTRFYTIGIGTFEIWNGGESDVEKAVESYCIYGHFQNQYLTDRYACITDSSKI